MRTLFELGWGVDVGGFIRGMDCGWWIGWCMKRIEMWGGGTTSVEIRCGWCAFVYLEGRSVGGIHLLVVQ